MIQHYQELLNECIDLQEHKNILHILKTILKEMREVNGNVYIWKEKNARS